MRRREAFIRRRRLLKGSAYYDLTVTGAALMRGRRLFETRRLLEEIRYLCYSMLMTKRRVYSNEGRTYEK